MCGDLEIRIDRDGQWFYHGSPIGRKELVRYFASLLVKDADGIHWLVSPVEKAKIEVEDVAFQAVELDAAGTGEQQILKFRTNVDEIVIADGNHAIRVSLDSATGEPSPYVMVRAGLEARLTRAVYYQLIDLAVERRMDGERVLGIWSKGIFFPVGKLDEDA